MRESACLRLELPDDERVALLLEDYDFFVKDQALFCDRLAALTELRGKAVVQGWQAQVAAGKIEDVVRELLLKHYDPGYASSIGRNFTRHADAKSIAPADRPRRPWPSWRAQSCWARELRAAALTLVRFQKGMVSWTEGLGE
jgi:tRNA 2-selenouridine synthase